MSKKPADDFDESNEIPSNWMKFNVPTEDKVFGTLIAKRTMKSTIPGQEGKLVNIYELKSDYGSYHVLDEKKKVVDEPITVEAGAFYSVGGTAVIDRQMQNIKVGQKIGFKFIEERPSKTKGFAPAKVVKVFAPKSDDGSYKMDTEWLEAENSLDKEFDKA